MSKLGANVFLIATNSNYLQSSAVCKGRFSSEGAGKIFEFFKMPFI